MTEQAPVLDPTPTLSGRQRVLHLYPCYQEQGQLPSVGDKSYCGRPKNRPSVDTGIPLCGNEHLGCVVCVELARAKR